MWPKTAWRWAWTDALRPCGILLKRPLCMRGEKFHSFVEVQRPQVLQGTGIGGLVRACLSVCIRQGSPALSLTLFCSLQSTPLDSHDRVPVTSFNFLPAVFWPHLADFHPISIRRFPNSHVSFLRLFTSQARHSHFPTRQSGQIVLLRDQGLFHTAHISFLSLLVFISLYIHSFSFYRSYHYVYSESCAVWAPLVLAKHWFGGQLCCCLPWTEFFDADTTARTDLANLGIGLHFPGKFSQSLHEKVQPREHKSYSTTQKLGAHTPPSPTFTWQ